MNKWVNIKIIIAFEVLLKRAIGGFIFIFGKTNTVM